MASRPPGRRHPGDPVQDGAIGGVIEVPERGGPVENPVEAACPRYLAHVPGHVFDADPTGRRVSAGPVQEHGRGIKASDPAATSSQAIGQIPVSAGQIQHVHARLQIQQLPGQLHSCRAGGSSTGDDGPVRGELGAVPGWRRRSTGNPRRTLLPRRKGRPCERTMRVIIVGSNGIGLDATTCGYPVGRPLRAGGAADGAGGAAGERRQR